MPWKGFCETVLGIQIDNKSNVENHIKSLCTKASQKLGILQIISNLLDAEKNSSLQFYNKISVLLLHTYFNVFFFSRRPDSLVNNVHKRALRIVYDDHNSPYSELSITNNECIIYLQNINVLMRKMHKLENDLSPPLAEIWFKFAEKSIT